VRLLNNTFPSQPTIVNGVTRKKLTGVQQKVTCITKRLIKEASNRNQRLVPARGNRQSTGCNSTLYPARTSRSDDYKFTYRFTRKIENLPDKSGSPGLIDDHPKPHQRGNRKLNLIAGYKVSKTLMQWQP